MYTNDFQGTVGSEWSNTSTDITPVGNRTFLGQFGNDTVSLTLDGLAPHDGLSISFDLFIIRTWDGNYDMPYGPDIWSLGVTNGPNLINTTFDNYPSIAPHIQAYPDNYLDDIHPPQTGASEVNTLGYISNLDPSKYLDSVYHLKFLFPHNANSVVFNFSGSNLQFLADESWGIDNVSVSIAPVPEPETYAMLLAGLGLLGFMIRRRKVPAA